MNLKRINRFISCFIAFMIFSVITTEANAIVVRGNTNSTSVQAIDPSEKIYSNPQLVSEIQGQEWFIDKLVSSLRKEKEKLTLGDLQQIKVLDIYIGERERIDEGSFIPDLIGRFTNLKDFTVWGDSASISYNYFKANGNVEYISDKISECSNLERVYISSTNLKVYPKGVFLLPNLKVLSFRTTGIGLKESLPKEILSLDKLEVLDLEWALIKKDDVPLLYELKNLKSLELRGNYLQMNIKECLNFKPTVFLGLENNYIYGSASSLLEFPSYLNVQVSDNYINFKGKESVEFKNGYTGSSNSEYVRGYRNNFFNPELATEPYNENAKKISLRSEKSMLFQLGSNSNEILKDIYNVLGEFAIVKGSSELSSYSSSLSRFVNYKLELIDKSMIDEEGNFIKIGKNKVQLKIEGSDEVYWEGDIRIAEKISDLYVYFIGPEGNSIYNTMRITQEVGTTLKMPAKEKEGYKFLGFYVNSNLVSDIYTFTESAQGVSAHYTYVEDINIDKKVDMSDFAMVGNNYNKKSSSSGFNKECDINKDGIIDIYDIVRVASKIK